MKTVIVIFALALIFPSTAMAGVGSPVQHKHGDRSHTHPLPESGRNHSHNKSSKYEKWGKLIESEDTIFEVKIDSYRPVTNINGARSALMVFQAIDTSSVNKTVFTSQKYVTLEDCSDGQGLLVTVSMKGDFLYTSDFVESGKSAASTMADFICTVSRNSTRLANMVAGRISWDDSFGMNSKQGSVEYKGVSK